MGNVSKRFLSMLVAFVMVFTMIPATVFATETTTTVNKTGSDTTAQDLPSAQVSMLKPLMLSESEHGYMCWPDGDKTVDRPLQIVMNFKANETLEECLAGEYSKYLVDFYLQVDGLANGTITADDCYLAGNYGSFGWIVIPADEFVLEEGVSYPVVSGYDATLNYKDICGSVKDFTAAIYISDAILNENPNFKVTLELKMKNPETGEFIVIGDPAVYTKADLEAGNAYLNGYADAKEEQVKNIANVNTNTTIATDEHAAVIEAAKDAMLDRFTGLTADEVAKATTEVVISFVKMDYVENKAPDKVSYDVTPVLKAGQYVHEVTTFTEPVTFRLPIAAAETRTKANVYHNDELMGVYPILGEGEGKYVEVSSKNFSTFTVDPIDDVAKVGDTVYDSLQDAINAANGKVVTLIADIELTDTVTVPAGVTMTLELNGYTISQTKEQTSGYQMILNDGNLTIQDSVGGGKISYTDSGNGGEYVSNTITNRGTLTLKSGTIENMSSAAVAKAGYPYAIDTSIWGAADEVNTIIEGGKVYCESYSALRLRADSETEPVNITITGGEVYGRIEVQNPSSNKATVGELTITGGTIDKNNSSKAIMIFGGGGTAENMTVAISGGNITGPIGYSSYSPIENFDEKIISGGTFSADVSDFVADGFELTDNGDGTFGVEVDPAYGKVAKIGDTYYATLAEAVAALKANGGTLTLLADANESITLNYPAEGAPVEVTIDLNGFTVTSAESTLWVSDGYNVTVMDSSIAKTGKIVSTSTRDEAIAIARGGKVTLEGGTISAPVYGIFLYNNGSTGNESLVMNGGHVVVDDGGTAIGVGAGSAVISGGTVEVKKTSGGWAMYIYDNASATISGGTIVGVPGGTNLTISGGTFKLITDTDVLRNDKLATACMFKDNGDNTYDVVNLNGYVFVGSGTEADPYVLSTKEDLFAFAVQYNSKLIARTVYVELGANIDLNDEEWTPIGDREADQGSFLGVFDGKGYTISNLWISEYTKTGAGFFSSVGLQSEHVTGTVKNVTFNNVTIVSNQSYVGVIAQAPSGALIENVHITGNVTISGYGYVGGIAGHGYPTINNSSVKADGTITANYWGAGAILGFAGDHGAKINNATVEGVEIHANYGGAASVAGSPYGAAINGATVSNVAITSNSDLCMGYVTAGGTLRGEIVVENVTSTANGVAVAPDQVAMIGDVIYTTLQDAFDAAVDGDTIEILCDITYTKDSGVENGEYVDGLVYTGDKSFTVDFNGFTITENGEINDYLIYLKNTGSKDNVITFTNGKIAISSSSAVTAWAAITVGSSSATAKTTLNLNGMEVVNGNPNDVSNQVIRIRNGAELNLNNGTVVTSNGTSYGVVAEANSTVNINSGATVIQTNSKTTSGNQVYTAVSGNGIINVYEGAVIESDNYGIHNMTTGNAVINIYGGTITAPVAVHAATNGGAGQTATVTITGGTFNGTLETYSNAADITVKGGTFDTDVSEFVADGFKQTDNGNGTFGVEVDPAYGKVAKIGDTYYATLQEAIDAADGKVVTLITDIELTAGIVVAAGTTVTLDLNGYVISGVQNAASGSAVITNKGNLTIKDSGENGKITCFALNPDTADSPTYANDTIKNNGTLTIEGGTIENSTETGKACFPIDCYAGSVLNISGGTVTGRGAIRLFASSETADVVLNITGGTVTGTSYAVWVQNSSDSTQGPNNTKETKATLNISGGNVGKILLEPSANHAAAITGGTIKEIAYWQPDTEDTSRNLTGFVSGGTFITDVSEFVADGFELTDNGDGTFGVVEEEPEVSISFAGASLLFKDEIRIKFYLTLKGVTDVELPNAGVEIYNSEDLTGTATVLTKLVKNGDYYNISTAGIAAKDMGDLLYVRAYIEVNGEKVYSDVLTYSPVEYCKYHIGMAQENQTDEAKMDAAKLCISLMNYGAKAQEYFGGYETLMNSFISAKQQAWLDGTAYDDAEDVKEVPESSLTPVDTTKIKLSGMRGVFKGALQMRVYAQAGVTGTVKLYYWTEATAGDKLLIENATEVTDVALSGGYYNGYITGIAAKDTGSTVYMCAAVTVGEDTYYSQVIAYSMHKYCAVEMANESEMAGLAEALVIYSNVAKEYMPKYNPQ